MAKSYEAAGVNLEAGYEVVRRIKSHVASTKRVGSMGNIGAFGGMFDLAALNIHKHVTDGERHGKLFPALTDERLFLRLARFYLTTNKFPQQSTRLCFRSLTYHKFIVIPY